VATARDVLSGGQDNKTGGCVSEKLNRCSFPSVITLDEQDIITEWRKIKQQKFGSLTISLISCGTEYVMDIGNKKKGRVCPEA